MMRRAVCAMFSWSHSQAPWSGSAIALAYRAYHAAGGTPCRQIAGVYSMVQGARENELVTKAVCVCPLCGADVLR